MAALDRERPQKLWFAKKLLLPMGANFKAFQGGIACFDSSAPGYVVQGQASTTLMRIGVFAETIDNTGGAAGALKVNVELDREVCGHFFAQDGTITEASIGTDAYVLDDRTVTATAAGRSVAGRVWMFMDPGSVALVGVALHNP